jgi:membrane associated rhomboid family serine protease
MSWEERGYASGSGNNWQPSGAGGGMRSWFGGLPAAGRAVKCIAIANVVMFVLCQVTGGRGSPVYQWLAMQTELVWHGQVWRLFTFTYLHDQGSLWHVLMNMIGLYFLGTPLERRWGSKPFFLFYTLGGFVAVALYTLLSSVGWLSPLGILVGASGGVLAVMGACAVLFPQFRVIVILFPVPIRALTVVLVALYTFNLFNSGANAGGDACHLAGLAFGVYFGYRGHRFFGKLDQMRAKAQEGAWQAKREAMLQQDERVDELLRKVKEQGIQSLSGREKKDLAEATKRQQAADRRQGF